MAKQTKKTAEERRIERAGYDERTALLRRAVERIMQRAQRGGERRESS